MNLALPKTFLMTVLLAACVHAADSDTYYPVQTVAGGSGGGGDVGQYSRLAHDPDGGQHIVYYDATYGDLKYAHRGGDAQAWTIEAVDTAGEIGRWCSLAIGAAQESTGEATLINGSRTVEITTGTTPTSVVAGGKFRIEPGGAWLLIAGVNVDAHRIELAAPYSGPTASNAPFRIRYYQPTLAYQGRVATGSSLRIARPFEAGRWAIADIDPHTTPTTSSHTGFETGVAIDSTGGIHVVYQDRATTETSTGQLRYAAYDGVDWTYSSPLPTESVAGADRICVDKAGRVWVFCRSNTANSLLALERTANGWIRYIVESSGRPGLALDASYNPDNDVFFLSSANEQTSATTALQLTSGSNGSSFTAWNTGTVMTIPKPAGEYTSIVSGITTGTQRLVYYDSAKRLQVVEPAIVGSPPTAITLDGGVDAGRYCSAQLSPADAALYVSYYDVRGTALKMARKEWSLDPTNGYVDGVKAGTYSDVGVTASEVIVAYHNETEGNLRVARWPRAGIPADGTDVVVDAVSANIGEYVSMAIDETGRIYLVYYDRANLQLRMAAWNGAEWLTTTLLGGQVRVGEFCRIAINANGTKLGIAWRDAEQLGLSYAIVDLPAVLDGMGAFTIVPATISAGGEVGRFLSVAWGDGEDFHMAYYNDKTFAPMYSVVGTSGTTGVVTETIEHSYFNVSGWFTSIAFGPAGQPLVVFQDVTHGSLKFAEREGDNRWTVTTIADDGDTGFYPVIRYDELNAEIYVVFYNQTTGGLILRSRPVDNTAWRTPLQLAGGTRGIHPAMAIDETGLMHLTFYHQSAGDLLYMNPSMPPIMNAARDWERYR